MQFRRVILHHQCIGYSIWFSNDGNGLVHDDVDSPHYPTKKLQKKRTMHLDALPWVTTPLLMQWLLLWTTILALA